MMSIKHYVCQSSSSHKVAATACRTGLVPSPGRPVHVAKREHLRLEFAGSGRVDRFARVSRWLLLWGLASTAAVGQPIDQTDDDGSPTGFGGGTFGFSRWNEQKQRVELSDPANHPTGVFVSRLIAATAS